MISFSRVLAVSVVLLSYAVGCDGADPRSERDGSMDVVDGGVPGTLDGAPNDAADGAETDAGSVDGGPIDENPVDGGTGNEDPSEEDPSDEDPSDEDPSDEDPSDEDPLCASSDPCAECICTACEAPLNACFTDAGCNDLYACYQEVASTCNGELGCFVSACALHAGAYPLLDDVSACSTSQCATACAGQSLFPDPLEPIDPNPGPGDDPPDAELCESAESSCEQCTCMLCADQAAACNANASCHAFIDCTISTGCSGTECLFLCLHHSAGLSTASALETCVDQSCSAECS